MPEEPIVPYLVRRLRAIGRPGWAVIARDLGLSRKLPEKLVYGERPNPTVANVQPLLDYFAAVDRGERTLPAARVRRHASR